MKDAYSESQSAAEAITLGSCNTVALNKSEEESERWVCLGAFERRRKISRGTG